MELKNDTLRIEEGHHRYKHQTLSEYGAVIKNFVEDKKLYYALKVINAENQSSVNLLAKNKIKFEDQMNNIKTSTGTTNFKTLFKRTRGIGIVSFNKKG